MAIGPEGSASRREFLRGSAVAAGAAALGTFSIGRMAHAAGGDAIKIGLVGCGGRGLGAALNALAADPNVKLIALADVFPDRLKTALENISKEAPTKVDVPPERCFTGLDAYKKLLECDVDLVLLCTPPFFRPMHFAAVVEAGKHCFVEKPVAVDAPGVLNVMETCKAAKAKNLNVVSGLCYRYDLPKRETIKRIHDGQIGDVVAMHVSYNAGTLWNFDRKPEWSPLEYQMRNWLYYTWLSGDFVVEQHVHSLDKAAWVMGDIEPKQAYGLGGRQVRVDEKFGNVFDHMAMVFEYANGVKLFANCRQMAGCSTSVHDHVMGTKGTAQLMLHRIRSEGNRWKYEGKEPNMYDQEHVELMAALRSGNPINNGDYMCRSTMMGIMARMVCYTGQTLTWEECLNSKEDLTPASMETGDAPTPVVARPGITPFT